jgi:S-disulfanyl-L-cysteine oxidoreductase SoxD
MNRLPLLALAASAVVLVSYPRHGESRPAHGFLAQTVWDSVFSDSQAMRGDSLYKNTCARCHGETLAGTDSAVSLAGKDFLVNWDGLALDQIYTKILAEMPSDKPGTLKPDQVADVLAHILSKNGFPAGKAPLPAEEAKLKEIKLTKTKP